MTATERKFLDNLKSLLKLDVAQTDLIDGEIDTFVEAAETAAPKLGVPLAQFIPAPNDANARPVTSEAELDKSILNYALLNGALDLAVHSSGASSRQIEKSRRALVYVLALLNCRPRSGREMGQAQAVKDVRNHPQ